MSESMIVGVDHGYAAMKTAHFSFPSGLVAYEHEPYTLKDVLEYGGKFYVVGSGRQALQKNKTQTEDYYLLTLAAIAKELSFRHAEPAAEIHLAAGLPLTSFGREKNAFREYLLRDGKTVNFRYEGQDYSIVIRKVSLFPQGYAAVLTQSILLDEPSVIVADIGGWTVDVITFINNELDNTKCDSKPLGILPMYESIIKHVEEETGKRITKDIIGSILAGKPTLVPEGIKDFILNDVKNHIRLILGELAQFGLSFDLYPTLFIGGGSLLFRKYIDEVKDEFGLIKYEFIENPNANALGYEKLIRQTNNN